MKRSRLRLELAAPRASTLFIISALLSGCGYVGDPLPPALNIPERVSDLRAVQRGDRIIVDYTLPTLTTEGLPIRKGTAVELRIGPTAEPFEIDRWAATALTVEPQEKGHAEAPARNWYGREVVVGVRMVTDQDRASEWSNLVTISVAPPLTTPANVRAVPHPKGIRLTWEAPDSDAQFRISRRSEDEKQASVVATVSAREYIDGAVTVGKRYEYSVHSILGNRQSEVSSVGAVTAADVFAPSAPAGITAVASLNTIELGWQGNTEGDLAHYRVYRGEAEGALSPLADKVEGPAYSDKQITSGKIYRYAVSAIDTAGNESDKTPPVQVVAP